MANEWGADDVRTYARDTMTKWMDGYFFPETGPQLRSDPMRVDGYSVDVRVHDMSGSTRQRTFRITVTAEDL